MLAYYNESDPFAAEWLRRLIAGGRLPAGDVDGRSIRRVRPGHVIGAAHAHFFAGIGGWPLALQLAQWPESLPVWTGSCPCQPFSQAGARGGADDLRHLWPTWFRLIRECRPPIVFGEQVASPDGYGWLDTVSTDLEGEGYAVGAADLAAAGVGAPHKRQRLFFVAYAPGDGRALLGEEQGAEPSNVRREPHRRRPAGGVGDTGSDRDRQHAGELRGDEGKDAERGSDGRHAPEPSSPARDPWADAEWLQCTDGVSRPAQPGAFPLAHGVPNRVGKLRGFGNAIVPELAARFIRASAQAIAEGVMSW